MSQTKKDKATLLLGISNPATVDRLLRLASILQEAGHLEVLLTHVATVASQISLTTGQSSSDVVRARDFLQQVKTTAGKAGLEAKAVVEVARTVDEGLLAAAKSHDARMVLVGYSDQDGPGQVGKEEEKFDRTMHRVARKAKTDVVVAKFRKDEMKKVLVPITARPPLKVTGLLCQALALQKETVLTFLHVLKPGDPLDKVRAEVAERLQTKGMERVGTLEVLSAEDPVDAIVNASAGYDLVMVGPSGRPKITDRLFTPTRQRIVEGVSASVFLAWSR